MSRANLSRREASSLPEAAPARLYVRRLVLTAFRNYGAAELVAEGRPLVLTGANGAGKTNLLEALSFLAPGRGLRNARLSEVDRHVPGGEVVGDRTWAVAAELETPEGARSIGTGREASDPDPASSGSSARERRLVKVDGAFVRGQQALAEILAVVWLVPQMDGLFRDSPGGRRRFLDRLVYGFDPAHAGRVAAYEQALRERSRLLKNGPADQAWLAALEDTMARHGIAIAAARRSQIGRLNLAGRESCAPFPPVALALDGEVDALLEQQPALAAEEALRERLAAARAQDAEGGGASSGPQRSDLSVVHLGRQLPAALCSTGEQKALLLSLVLAQSRLLALDRGAPPLLLLDEVVAHLDAAHRRALFDQVLGLGAQAWMSGTERGPFTELEGAADFFGVVDARIARQSPYTS